MKKGEIVEVTIEKLAFGGLGITTFEGLKLFVADTVPGDTVQVKITKKKTNFAEGKLIEILESSQKRIQARCKHFEICGGCTWQFLSYEDQLFYKEQIVKESLEHIGGFKDISVHPIIGCQNPWNYRNKMEFSLAVDETRKPDIGLHPKGYHYDVFTLTECHLPSPRYAEIVKTLRQWMQENTISVYESRSNSGLLKNVTIRHNQNGEIMINVVTNKGGLAAIEQLKKVLDFSDIVSLIHTQVLAEKGKPTTRKQTVLWGKDHLEEQLSLRSPWGQLQFSIYPEAFFQPNPVQAGSLYAEALDRAEISHQDTVLDLYCGTGTLGLFASRKAQHVIGIDNVPDAIKSAKENAIRNQINNIEFYVGDAAQVLDQLAITPNKAIVDPPRAGMTPDTITLLGKLNLETIIYISCNPTTQARDLKLLGDEGYTLTSVQPVDMFPHTYHIENIVVLRKS